MRTALSLSAMIMGVASMVLLVGLVGGIERANMSMFIEGSLGAIQVHKKGYVAAIASNPLRIDMADDAALRGTLAKIPGVRSVAPRIVFGALLSVPPRAGSESGEAVSVMLTGVEEGPEKATFPRRSGWVSRWPGALADPAGLTLASDFADGLDATVVDDPTQVPLEAQIAVLANDRDEALNGVNAVLLGTVRAALAGDRRYGFLSLDVAQRLLRMEGRVTEYALGVDDWAQIPAVAARVKEALGPEFEVHRWDELMPLVKTVARSQHAFAFVLSGIVMLVLLLGLSNTVLLGVNDRVREIGVLLALGFRRAQVRQLFVAEGLVLALTGAVLGGVAGVLGIVWIRLGEYRLPAPGGNVALVIEPTLAPGTFIALVGLTLLAGVLASFWAAGKAAALSPVEALRE